MIFYFSGGCGFCKKVCNTNTIEIIDKKPKWNNSCTHCMGCINICPTKAINYGKKTEKKADILIRVSKNYIKIK